MTFVPTRRRLLIVLALVLWGFGTHGTYAGTGDEPHYLAIAHSIAFDGDLDVANNYSTDEPLILSGGLEPEGHRRQGAGGTLRPIHDIGLPLVIAPYIRIAVPLTEWFATHVPESLMRRAKLNPSSLYRHILSLAMIALACVLAAAMFDAFILLGASMQGAFWFTLLLVASPPLLVYSTLLFTELLTALLVFVLFVRLVLRPAVSPVTWLVIGIATGFLVLVHLRNIGFVVGLSIVAAFRLRQLANWRTAGAFAAGVGAMLMTRTVLNHHLWGTWLTSPHAMSGEWHGWSEVLRDSGMRFVAMLVDQEYGLLIYAPVYLLAFAGLPAMFKGATGVGLAIVLIAVSYLMPVLCPLTNIHGWSGQWCPAARFLTPLLPMVGLAMFFAWSRLRWPAMLLIAVQILVSAYYWQHPKLLWNDGNGRAAFCSRVGEGVCKRLPALATTVH